MTLEKSKCCGKEEQRGKTTINELKKSLLVINQFDAINSDLLTLNWVNSSLLVFYYFVKSKLLIPKITKFACKNGDKILACNKYYYSFEKCGNI